ncbi:hypothetical protein [Thermus sediminis]|uniref:hypothetical protein n=1 Tax=Thermus sediminis TaxID=1761908 RepID=UPI000E3E5415|nr:hypothetical protein [Thermus sediminis]
MRAWIALAFLGLAMGQSILLPERVQVGQTFFVEGRGLPEGRFPLEVVGPEGALTLEAESQGGEFRLPLTLEAPGEYRVRLSLPSGALERRLAVLAAQAPELLPEGLGLPWGVLPLPPGNWLGPLLQGERVFVAQGLLVVEANLAEPGARYHFAPRRVVALRPGPEALLAGDWVLPLPFPPLPFEGTEEDLRELLPLLEALNPPRPWPYYAYWTLDPLTLTEADLTAYGQDLLLRGHRPELLFAQEGVARMAEAARQLAQENPAQAQRLTEALLAHTPLFPGSLAFFRERAEALEAQGEAAKALRLREAKRLLRTWLPPELGFLPQVLYALALAYLALLLYLFLYYLPAQLRDLRPIGGFLGGFFRHPLLRLRHLSLAYASLGERLLALLLLLALGGGFLFFGLDQEARAAATAPPLDRGTLRTQEALDWLREQPPIPEVKALLGYALLPQAPKEAKGLLEEGGFPFAKALLGEEASLAQAYREVPLEGPVRSALGLGQDPWGKREPGPSTRTLYLTLLRVELGRFLEDPLRGASRLPLPLPERGRPWAVLGFVLLLLYHLLAFLLPRRRGEANPTWTLAVRLLVPGSPGFSGGLGLFLLLLASFGLLQTLQGQGVGLLLLAYGLHLLFLLGSLRRSS